MIHHTEMIPTTQTIATISNFIVIALSFWIGFFLGKISKNDNQTYNK